MRILIVGLGSIGKRHAACLQKMDGVEIAVLRTAKGTLKDKSEFLHVLVSCFHQKLPSYSDFSKELLQAEEWANANVNIRGILEYLMQVMPTP